ncbi:MAG TPA: M55 family metallopeptidase [Terriglobia bacterium]|nr:M55 family metallopeptidase [Terriglobia bacterium]
MGFDLKKRIIPILVLILLLSSTLPASAQTRKGKKIFMVTDMEGVDGIFNWEDQCRPFVSPRWAESQKLLTGEVNAAVGGLYAGGATEVVVADLHNASRSLSALTIDPRAKLLQGQGIPPTLGIDSSYSAVIFIGQHAMAGAKDAVISHTYSFTIQNLWVNDILVGELGSRTMLAGYFGVPVIMVAGDTAVCEEFHKLVPNGECAAVKTGFSRTGGISLSHNAACDLIRQKAELAMEHLSEYKPYKVSNPVEIKVEYTVQSTPVFWPQSEVKRLDERTYLYSGKDFLDAWLKQPLR